MNEANRRSLRSLPFNGTRYIRDHMLYIERMMTPEQRQVVSYILDHFVELIPESLTPLQRVQLIYNVLTRLITYSYDYPSNESRFSYVSALMSGRAVCEGISELFYELATRLGVPCYLVIGAAGRDEKDEELHAWNKVRLTINGVTACYNLDCTWDVQKPPSNYSYFLKSDATFRKAYHDWLPGCYPDAPFDAVSIPPLNPAGVDAVYDALQRLIRRAKHSMAQKR